MCMARPKRVPGVQLDVLRMLVLHFNWIERALEAQEPQQQVVNQDVLQMLRLFCILARSCVPLLHIMHLIPCSNLNLGFRV